MNKKITGFTLIELLVVISIIALLSSVVLASLQSARNKAKSAKKQTEMNQVLTALQSYAIDNNGDFPSNPIPGSACNIGVTSGCLTELVPKYLPALPVAPSNSGGNYQYYNYSTYIRLSTIMNPQQYGPWSYSSLDRGQGCSAGSIDTKRYCLGIIK